MGPKVEGYWTVDKSGVVIESSKDARLITSALGLAAHQGYQAESLVYALRVERNEGNSLSFYSREVPVVVNALARTPVEGVRGRLKQRRISKLIGAMVIENFGIHSDNISNLDNAVRI